MINFFDEYRVTLICNKIAWNAIAVNEKRSWCYICVDNDTKYITRCQNSNKFICKNHTKIHLFQVYRTLERDKVDVVQNAFLYVISCQN